MFSGQIIDGPLIGRNLAWRMPYYEIVVQPPGPALVADDGPMAPALQRWQYRYNDRLKVWHALSLDLLRDMPDGLAQ